LIKQAIPVLFVQTNLLIVLLMSEGAAKVHEKNKGNHGTSFLMQTAAATASDKKRKTRHL
jgi:hypothetical protein